MAFEAAAYPPFSASFHADPPVEAFEQLEGACNTKVTGGVSVTCVHDPRPGQEWHVYADGVVKAGRSGTVGGRVGSGSWGTGLAYKQGGVVVSLEQAAFCGKVYDVGGLGPCM